MTLQKLLNRIEFQSTLPRRERRKANVYNEEHWWVSIHAPTKGATPSAVSSFPLLTVFQSTLPRRERRFASSISFSRV